MHYKKRKKLYKNNLILIQNTELLFAGSYFVLRDLPSLTFGTKNPISPEGGDHVHNILSPLFKKTVSTTLGPQNVRTIFLNFEFLS